jgi:long-chain fatty acid transport protein
VVGKARCAVPVAERSVRRPKIQGFYHIRSVRLDGVPQRGMPTKPDKPNFRQLHNPTDYHLNRRMVRDLLALTHHQCVIMAHVLWLVLAKPVMFNQCNLSKLLAVVLLSGLARDAAANGFGLPDQDAFATARGEAFVATADNASAIYYNPAGIAQLTNSNLRGGLNSVYYEPTYEPPYELPNGKPNPNNGRTYYSSANFAYLPQLFYTYSASGAPLSCGLGIYAPYGGNMSWPEDTGFRSVAVSGSLKYITINPVVAIRLLPSLSVGGGAMFNYGNISMLQGLNSSTKLTNFFNFAGDGWSVGYNAGILWQPIAKLSFGATFRSSASLNFQGNTEFQYQPKPYYQPAYRDASTSFTFPLTTVFGISYRPTSQWNLEFDANYTGWQSFGTATIEQSPPQVKNPLINNIPVNLDWQASWMYEFGVTRYFDNGWHVSGGYVFNANSVPDTYYTPLAADLNRNFFSLGAGFSGKHFDFDIAYQLGFAFKRDVSGSTSPTKAITASSGQTADGTYGFSSQAIIATVGVHF